MNDRRRPSKAQRGSALILTVFILFAMLGLGMLALRSATQNMAGSGNLRLGTQARYVAEMGLYHAVTLINRQGATILPQRDQPNLVGGTIEIESASPDRPERSRVLFKDEGGVTRQQPEMVAPSFLTDGPPSLGVAGVASVSYTHLTLPTKA